MKIKLNSAAEYDRLKALDVVFRGEPHKTGPASSVLPEDTCGNLLLLYRSLDGHPDGHD